MRSAERGAKPDERRAGTRETFIPDIQGSFMVRSMRELRATLTKAVICLTAKAARPNAGFRYTGQRVDPDTNGLYYYRARMYMPAWGRFMQTNPI